MNNTNYERELLKAKEIARETWALVAPLYDLPLEGLGTENKSNDTPVTKADKLANKHILESLQKHFPGDSIVSEEAQKVSGGERTWYIDPIDGTKGFIKRNGHFAIHIGFCERDTPVMGVVYWALSGDMYSGIVGKGATRENVRGSVDLRVVEPAKNLVAIMNRDDPIADLAPFFTQLGIRTYHNCGSEGLRLMKLAEGRAAIRVGESSRGTNTWDLCAPQAIVEAAGGLVRFVEGDRIEYRQQAGLGRRYMACVSQSLLDKSIETYRSLNELSSRDSFTCGPSDDEAHYHVYTGD